MFIHAKLGHSTVNGPGPRAVVWFQGCVGMNCPGCWNPETHQMFTGEEVHSEDLAKWITAQPEISGVTFSGGEPMHQAPGLVITLLRLKEMAPDLSVGMFTGYTENELKTGSYRCHITRDNAPIATSNVRRMIWEHIRECLDFAVMGRYNQLKPANSQLCSSENQRLRLFSKRYTEADFAGPLEVEVTVDEDLIQITGFPVEGVEL